VEFGASVVDGDVEGVVVDAATDSVKVNELSATR